MDLEIKMVYLLLGSNLGDRFKLIEDAASMIEQHIGTVEVSSSLYETAAWGKEDQPAFLNSVVAVNTSLSPMEVLEKALWIEKELGRVRHEKWGSRLIDIDILLYDKEIIDIEETLQVPHPQMQYRKFVLMPLAEIAGDLIHPVLQIPVKEILLHLRDNLEVSKI
jgi:2-amino-4-hydroxy-6-hydroxymethyldihydropteridine diphosphokinase